MENPQTTLTAILLCVAVFVFIELVKYLIRLSMKKPESSVIVLIPVYGGDCGIEAAARRLRLRIYDDGLASRMVFVNLGADNETLEICRRLCNDSGFELAEPEELQGLFER